MFKNSYLPMCAHSRISSGTKVVRHVILHNILKGRIFPTSFTRKDNADRKVRNRDAKSAYFCSNWYSKICLLMHDNLVTKCCRTKKESFNLVQK